MGKFNPLAWGVSPLALNVMRRKTTVTTRKSIMLVSERLALAERCPPPEIFFSTNSRPTCRIKRRPGFWTGIGGS
jgi:hypothetical protein